MSLIKPSKPIEKKQVRVRLSDDIFESATAYAKWANFSNLDECIEKALIYVLDKDKEWQNTSKATTVATDQKKPNAEKS